MDKNLDKLKGKNMRRVVAIVATLLLAVLVAGLAACSAATLSGEIGAGNAIGEALTGITGKADGIELPEQGMADDGQPEEQMADTENELPADEQGGAEPAHEQAPRERKAATQAQSSGSDASPSSSDGPSPAPGAQAPSQQRKWVEETERVWVEDKAAWSEQVPVYGTREVSICNICGQDIRGNTSAHGKAHMIAGEGSGHHSEVRREVTGYNTVSHPAEGHYETRVVGGHWE